jgi:hypothetical protein
VPRVVNAAMAAFLLLFLVPMFGHLSGRATSVQVMLGFLSVPLVLLTVACLTSAIRPGALGRAARNARSRRAR